MANKPTGHNITGGISGVAKANTERGMSGVSTANGGDKKPPSSPPASSSGQSKKQ